MEHLPLFERPPGQPLQQSSEKRFRAFHAANPHVYRKFCELLDKLLKRGVRHYGAKAVFEVLRYHTLMETTDRDFKLNNNYTAFYARMWLDDHPGHDDFFQTRKQKVDHD